MDGIKTACIISFTPVDIEPRLIRQARAFAGSGWRVVVCGYSTGADFPPEALLVVLPRDPVHRSVQTRARLILRLIAARFSLNLSEKFYWDYIPGPEYLRIIRERLAGAPISLFVAHDYVTAPVASVLAEENNAPFVLDVHEYATEQYMHDPLWRLLFRRWIYNMQCIYLRKASVVSTVCRSIAVALQKDYRLAATPAVVRSVPEYREMPLNTPGDVITVLYHGNITPTRGIEQLILSVRDWEPRFRLIIRGKGDKRYLETLSRLAEKTTVDARVEFEGPVAFSCIIDTANAADIGFFVQEDTSRQKRYALPNKFFEYVMAGLALCVNEFPEMSSLVAEYNLGKTVSKPDPGSIARVINSFTAEEILHYKSCSLAAARQLCWEKEDAAMLEAYTRS